MRLALYYHPLASYCHKVLIALDELGLPFEPRQVDLLDPDSAARFQQLWPVGKMPVLHDRQADRTLPESSIIIEYLDGLGPGPRRLLPEAEALEIRLWDRCFDLYVQTPLQKIVIDRLRPEAERDPAGVAEARAALRRVYALLESRLAGRTWIAGTDFSLAECAAAPALFYAAILEPFASGHTALAAYFERLLDRPSMRRTLDQARPYFGNFPYYEAMPARFR